MTVARPARAYVLASAVALAGMVLRMGWIDRDHVYAVIFVGCVILGIVLLFGTIAAVTWVFISILGLIFGKADSPPGVPPSQTQQPS